MKCDICGKDDNDVIYVSTTGHVHRECKVKQDRHTLVLNVVLVIIGCIVCTAIFYMLLL